MIARNSPPRSLMEEAIAQRSRCFLTLPEATTGLRELSCSILAASSRGLLLETCGTAAPGPHWVGLPVTGYFRVALRRGGFEETFYTFDSSIQAAEAGPAGHARLRLREPDSLVFGQRRKSLRVEPPLERLQKVFLWRYDKRSGFSLDAPALRSTDFLAGLARLTDISAGGLGLALRSTLVRERDLDLDKGQRLVVHIRFTGGEAADEGFWMVARVSHASRDRACQDLSLGLEFLASGTLDPKAGKIRWEQVEDHVIPGLADIFFHWHLERHREKLA